jgi:hypothetical protein
MQKDFFRTWQSGCAGISIFMAAPDIVSNLLQKKKL